jgi:hypothetical protein
LPVSGCTWPEFSGGPQSSAMIDAVLPLTSRDAGRARILRVSLDKHFSDLATCWVVTPDSDASVIAGQFASSRYRVVPESKIVPELSLHRILTYRAFRRLTRIPSMAGWYVQQLVKLAAADLVETEFYLTLDADVICTRRVRYGDLVKDGKAIGERLDQPAWSEDTEYDRAAHILRLPRSTWMHPVTPSIFSRTVVRMMQQHIAGLISKPWRHFPGVGTWRGHLILNLPWTEYTLYATFVSGRGLYERFHFKDDYVRTLYGNSAWNREHFSKWDPAKSFTPQADHYFVVIQSNRGIDTESVWAKVGPYLETPK